MIKHVFFLGVSCAGLSACGLVNGLTGGNNIDDCPLEVDGWTCPSCTYDAQDGCDCDCGVPDPDCNDASQDVFCLEEEESCIAGTCVIATCPVEGLAGGTLKAVRSAFGRVGGRLDEKCGGAGRGHEVSLILDEGGAFGTSGAFDTSRVRVVALGLERLECISEISSSPVLRCELCNDGSVLESLAIQASDDDGQWSGPICATRVPAGWQCTTTFYDAKDGCDCSCGVVDPDCVSGDQQVFGCQNGQVCTDGVCT